MEEKMNKMKGTMGELETVAKKVEDEKKHRDSQIKTLNEEMAIQEEAMAKLNKEKKGVEEQIRAVNDSLAAEEDKCNALNKMKHKLESNIDDVSTVTSHELGVQCSYHGVVVSCS